MNRRRPGVVFIAALCGIAIAVGALLPWVEARGPRPASGITHTSIAGLFHWSYQDTDRFLRSFGLVVLVAGVLVFLGALAAGRLVVGLFALVALAAAGLWIGLNVSHYNPTDLLYSDLRIGAWLTVVGGLVALFCAFVIRRRRRF